MTLTEYLNQADPVHMPFVMLEQTEIKVWQVIPRIKKALVEVPKLYEAYGVNAQYIIEEGDPALWVMDNDGNPRARSCFRLKDSNTIFN